MDIASSLIIITLAGLIHASFQLSISVLTLLSGHAIGKKRSTRRLLALTNSFTFGVASMTILLLCLLGLTFNLLGASVTYSLFTWSIACGLLIGVGASVILFYYRREHGTTLWIPRAMARFLSGRTKATKHSAEAFTLGMGSVVAELLFIIAPLVIATLVIVQLSPTWQLLGIGLYVITSLASLLVVTSLVGSGHSISKIQKWREENKRFLQLSAGSGLFVLGFYVYVEHVTLVSALAAAGGV